MLSFLFTPKISVELFAPSDYGDQPCSFHEAGPRLLRDVIGEGGCGPGSGLGDFLVPDTMWLLSVKPACMIHDWMYAWGRSREDKERADDVFLNNMQRIVLANTRSRCLRKKRMQRAELYYWAVKVGGGPAFWDEKNRPEEMAVVKLAA